MRITKRDVRLLRDMALSHVLSRDQVISLGYFATVTRANSRLRELSVVGVVRRIATPFFAQGLYVTGRSADSIVGERIGQLLRHRSHSPRFLQHALATTEVRMALLKRGADHWYYEQQVQVPFRFAGKDYIVKPDGLMATPSGLVAVEVDLGHVAPSKFRQKLLSYDAFVNSGECKRMWRSPSFSLLVVTTGSLRASRLARLCPTNPSFELVARPHDDLAIPFPGGWS